MAAIKTVKAIVALRRTVIVDNKQCGPGTEVTLPADEVAELRASGFLVDPAATDAPPVADGPSFDNTDPAAVVVSQA